ncbi:MAG TPA: LPXTG cell wall anchor domain-containing protein [Candidatus Saccharimonadales bacterium]|nr:LPXTG cell wall anchor domain-containing protein [Candidatus Saccharimonadales bacterium]
MKKLVAAIKRAPKSTAFVATIAAAVVVPAALFAWGPQDRPTYTYENPADHVTFNSMTGTPHYGDERNFVRIKEAAAANSTYSDKVNFQPGKEYSVMVYFHNNAKTSLNSEANQFKGIATNTKLRVQMPATVKAGETASIVGFLSADNAQPKEVVDEAEGVAANNIALRYVADSAVITSNGAVNGTKLPETLYTTGTHLGFNALDGKLPGCNEFAGYVIFKVKVDQPNFTIEKTVSEKGKNAYQETLATKAGSDVEYKIHYKNTGTTVQNDVVIKDVLPAGVSYVAGSTQVSNAASNNQWKATTNNEVTKGGLNIGNYAAGGGAYVKFTAKVADNTNLKDCGVNTLVNTATAQTNNGNKSDTATVTVTKTCAAVTPTKPVTPTEPVTPETPETPAELPKTGAGEAILSLFGLGALVTASSYYIASRRTL